MPPSPVACTIFLPVAIPGSAKSSFLDCVLQRSVKDVPLATYHRSAVTLFRNRETRAFEFFSKEDLARLRACGTFGTTAQLLPRSLAHLADRRPLFNDLECDALHVVRCDACTEEVMHEWGVLAHTEPQDVKDEVVGKSSKEAAMRADASIRDFLLVVVPAWLGAVDSGKAPTDLAEGPANNFASQHSKSSMSLKIAIFIDKNVPPRHIESATRKYEELVAQLDASAGRPVSLTFCALKFGCERPDVQRWNYPWSIQSVAECIHRVSHRTNHPNLQGSDSSRIILSFLHISKATNLSKEALAECGVSKSISVPMHVLRPPDPCWQNEMEKLIREYLKGPFTPFHGNVDFLTDLAAEIHRVCARRPCLSAERVQAANEATVHELLPSLNSALGRWSPLDPAWAAGGGGHAKTGVTWTSSVAPFDIETSENDASTRYYTPEDVPRQSTLPSSHSSPSCSPKCSPLSASSPVFVPSSTPRPVLSAVDLDEPGQRLLPLLLAKFLRVWREQKDSAHYVPLCSEGMSPSPDLHVTTHFFGDYLDASGGVADAAAMEGLAFAFHVTHTLCAAGRLVCFAVRPSCPVKVWPRLGPRRPFPFEHLAAGQGRALHVTFALAPEVQAVESNEHLHAAIRAGLRSLYVTPGSSTEDWCCGMLPKKLVHVGPFTIVEGLGEPIIVLPVPKGVAITGVYRTRYSTVRVGTVSPM